MLHHPPPQSPPAPSQPSRVAVLARDYERWYRFYRHVGAVEDDPNPQPDEAAAEKLNSATAHAVRIMHATMDEITMTPARSLADFGAKAMIVREYLDGDWYAGEVEDRGIRLAATMMVELIELAGLQPLPVPDVTPPELLEGYVEPVSAERPSAFVIDESNRPFDRTLGWPL